MLFFDVVLASFALVLVAGVVRFTPPTRTFGEQKRSRLALALIGVAALVLLVGTLPWTAPSLWSARIESSAERLRAGIERYASVHGAAPDRLEDLVPEFLPEVPGTGYPGQPEFAYLTQWEGGGRREWRLVVWTDWPFDLDDDEHLEYGPRSGADSSQR